jgi:Calcineurin-like phosphoesterase
MRTLAIGDVHGCYRSLCALLEAVRVTPEDVLVFLGDYIDRGTDSKRVLDWLIEESARRPIVSLRGNHEVMILEFRNHPDKFQLWAPYGGNETLRSYGTEPGRDWVQAIPAAHWKFIEDTRPWYETDTHLFVHAGLDPELELEDQSSFSLYWQMFDAQQPHPSGKTVVCGHTSQKSGLPKDLGYAVCLDTSACRGLWLTCLDVQARTYWQANEAGETRTGRLPPR